jgi:hypothetical protein
MTPAPAVPGPALIEAASNCALVVTSLRASHDDRARGPVRVRVSDSLSPSRRHGSVSHVTVSDGGRRHRGCRAHVTDLIAGPMSLSARPREVTSMAAAHDFKIILCCNRRVVIKARVALCRLGFLFHGCSASEMVHLSRDLTAGYAPRAKTENL